MLTHLSVSYTVIVVLAALIAGRLGATSKKEKERKKLLMVGAWEVKLEINTDTAPVAD